MKRLGVVFILILAFAGLADSAYLAEHEINGTPLICNIQNFDGCNIVANSQYSQLFGIPLAEYGVLFYGILFVLAALELVLFDRLLRRVLQGVSLLGVVFSLYFTSLQVFVIGAFCVYCVVSALITFLVLILASFIEPIRKRAKQIPVAPASPEVPQSTPHLPMPPSA
ncbi:MAG: vitamin K epoxide reductase family protein [Minisyncoccia bacterium]